jgi:hypothetical protein
VATFSDFHFIFFLELTHRILMVVPCKHGMAMVFLISWDCTASLQGVCYHSLSTKIKVLIITTFGDSKVCLMKIGQHFSAWNEFEMSLGSAYLPSLSLRSAWAVIRPKRIYFPEHFCNCFSSNLCVLNTTNTD